MPSLLFVCTANQCRSPLAADMFNSCVQNSELKDWHADSAGTWAKTGQAVERPSLQLANVLGVDLLQYRTISIEDVDLDNYDLVVVMEKGHLESLMAEYPAQKEKIHLATVLAGMASSDIPDPLMLDRVSAVSILLDLQECVRLIQNRILLGEIQPCVR
jgi:protein-tyrosine phosphatase